MLGGGGVTGMIDGYARLWNCSSTISCYPHCLMLKAIAGRLMIFRNQVLPRGVTGVRDQARQTRSGNARHMARKDQTKVYLAHGISPQGTLGTVRGVVVRLIQRRAPVFCWPGSRCKTALHCTARGEKASAGADSLWADGSTWWTTAHRELGGLGEREDRTGQDRTARGQGPGPRGGSMSLSAAIDAHAPVPLAETRAAAGSVPSSDSRQEAVREWQRGGNATESTATPHLDGCRC